MHFLVRLLSVSTIFILCALRVWGQGDFRQGWVITIENDTIEGEIEYRSNAKNSLSCRFRGTWDIVEYTPDQLTAFRYLNDKYFSSTIIPNIFVEVIVRGEISLFKSESTFYILKRGDELRALQGTKKRVEVEGKVVMKDVDEWKGTISYLISDCFHNSSSLVQNIKLNEKDLTKILEKYNKCKGDEFMVYKENKPWSKFSIGGTAGVCWSNIYFSNRTASLRYLDEVYTSVDPTIGFIVSISAPRVSEKLIFQPEVHLTKSSYSSFAKFGKDPLFEYNDIYINLTTLSVPLSLRYTTPEIKYSMYIQAGINLDFHLQAESQRIKEEVHWKYVETFESEAIDINRNTVGYFVGIGLQRAFSSLRGSLSIRYSGSSGFSTIGGTNSRSDRISLILILQKK